MIHNRIAIAACYLHLSSYQLSAYQPAIQQSTHNFRQEAVYLLYKQPWSSVIVFACCSYQRSNVNLFFLAREYLPAVRYFITAPCHNTPSFNFNPQLACPGSRRQLVFRFGRTMLCCDYELKAKRR